MGFRIVVDRDLCQGHAVCESEAAEVFTVSKNGDLTVTEERPEPELLEKVQLAVKYCPTHALTIVAD